MTESVKLSRVASRFAELTYPVSRETAAERFDGVDLLFADGDADLGGLISAIDADAFDSADDLFSDLQNELPIGAVGEPGQSEGDA
ncbi:MAG: hypothetical protein ABEJ28_04105 [Salinigranum sp.]